MPGTQHNRGRRCSIKCKVDQEYVTNACACSNCDEIAFCAMYKRLNQYEISKCEKIRKGNYCSHIFGQSTKYPSPTHSIIWNSPSPSNAVDQVVTTTPNNNGSVTHQPIMPILSSNAIFLFLFALVPIIILIIVGIWCIFHNKQRHESHKPAANNAGKDDNKAALTETVQTSHTTHVARAPGENGASSVEPNDDDTNTANTRLLNGYGSHLSADAGSRQQVQQIRLPENGCAAAGRPRIEQFGHRHINNDYNDKISDNNDKNEIRECLLNDGTSANCKAQVEAGRNLVQAATETTQAQRLPNNHDERVEGPTMQNPPQACVVQNEPTFRVQQ